MGLRSGSFCRMKELLERHWKLGITNLIRNLLQATTLQMLFFSNLYDKRSTNCASKLLFKFHERLGERIANG